MVASQIPRSCTPWCRSRRTPRHENPAVACEARIPVGETRLGDSEARAFRRQIPEYDRRRVFVVGGNRSPVSRHGHALNRFIVARAAGRVRVARAGVGNARRTHRSRRERGSGAISSSRSWATSNWRASMDRWASCNCAAREWRSANFRCRSASLACRSASRACRSARSTSAWRAALCRPSHAAYCSTAPARPMTRISSPAVAVAISARLPSHPLRTPVGQAGTAGEDGPVVEEPAEIGGKLGGRGVTVGRGLRHRLQDDRLEVDRDRRVELPRRRGLVLGDLAEDFESIVAGERGTQSEQLVDRHAQRVDVRSAIERGPPSQRLLGAHVPGRAQGIAGVGQVQAAPNPGQSEVGDPEFARPYRS